MLKATRYRGARFGISPGTLIAAVLVSGLAPVLACAGDAAPAAGPDAAESAAAPSEAADTELREVTVVAQRRSENLQNVSVAVSTLSGTQLQEQGVLNANDLMGKVPSFTIRDAGLFSQFNIRGSVSNSYDPNTETPVSVYIDDVYRGAPVSQLTQIFDIEHVEVLRGPQGTLFGRNSTGGLVNFITNGPTKDFEGYLDAEGGSYGQRIIDGAVSGPLLDGVQGRVAFIYNQDDGWQKNLEHPDGPNFNAKDEVAARFQLKAEVTDDLTAQLSFAFDRERNRFQGYSDLGAVSPVTGGNCSLSAIYSNSCVLATGQASLSTNNWKEIYSAASSLPFHLDTRDTALKLTWRLGEDANLTSITASNYTRWFYVEDDNGTGLTSRDSVFSFFYGGLNSDQLTQELRLDGRAGKWTYVAGLYYLYSDDLDSLSQFDITTQQVQYPSLPRIITNSVSGYAQTNYSIVDKVNLILGARYTADRKTLNFYGTTYEDPYSTPLHFNESSNTGKVTWKAGPEWHARPSLLLYATASTGYKSPEFNVDVYGTLPTTPVAKPETITSFEVGEKWESADRRLRVNADAYINKTRNKQGTSVVELPDGHQGTSFYNFGDVKAHGVEFDLTAKPTAQIELGLNGAWTYTQIVSNPADGLERTYDDVFSPFNGSREVDTPLFSYNAHARYTVPFNRYGEFAAQAEWRWQSKVYWTVANNPEEVENAYGILNLRLFWTSPDSKLTASVFVENALDKQYANLRFWPNSADVLTVQWGQPRWMGARLGYRF